MAVYTIPVLLTRISTYIKANGTKDITGPVMQSILTDVVDSLNAIIGPSLNLSDVLGNGNDAAGQDINLNGADASLTSAAGFFGTLNALLYATGVIILKSNNDVVNMRNNADFDLTFALSGLTASRQLTFQDKAITVAGLVDITNALLAYLKLDGTTPMTGDLDMLTNGVAVRTDEIKTSLGLLELIYGIDSLIFDLSSVSGGGGASYTQTFRSKSGTIAHLDDLNNITGNVAVTGQINSALPATLVPSGTTQTVNWDNGNAQVIDLGSATGNVTLTLSNPIAGATYLLKVIQGATARQFVYPTSVKWSNGIEPEISTGNDEEDLISLFYDGTNYLAVTSQNFS